MKDYQVVVFTRLIAVMMFDFRHSKNLLEIKIPKQKILLRNFCKRRGAATTGNGLVTPVVFQSPTYRQPSEASPQVI